MPDQHKTNQQHQRARAALSGADESDSAAPEQAETPSADQKPRAANDQTESARTNARAPISEADRTRARAELHDHNTPTDDAPPRADAAGPPPTRPSPASEDTSETDASEKPEPEPAVEASATEPEPPEADTSHKAPTEPDTEPSDGAESADRNETLEQIYEAKRRRGELPNHDDAESDNGNKRVVFLITSILLIGGGLGILGVFGAQFFTSDPEPSPIQIRNNLIAADTRKTVAVGTESREALLSRLTDARRNAPPAKTGELVLTTPVANTAATKQLAANDVFPLLAPSAPPAFIRTITDRYIFGYYGTEKKPFIVAGVESAETGLPGLITWEDGMVRDLGPYFGIPAGDGAHAFRDRLLQNKSVRVLPRDNTTVLAHMFLSANVIAIAPDIATLEALLGARRSAREAAANTNATR